MRAHTAERMSVVRVKNTVLYTRATDVKRNGTERKKIGANAKVKGGPQAFERLLAFGAFGGRVVVEREALDRADRRRTLRGRLRARDERRLLHASAGAGRSGVARDALRSCAAGDGDGAGEAAFRGGRCRGGGLDGLSAGRRGRGGHRFGRLHSALRAARRHALRLDGGLHARLRRATAF